MPPKTRKPTQTHDRVVFLLLVTGGRDFSDKALVDTVMSAAVRSHGVTHVIHGDARGADKLCGDWAKAHGLAEVRVPANWDYHGNSAGPIRNAHMAELRPNMLLAFPGGNGTKNMVEQSHRHGIPVVDAAKLAKKLAELDAPKKVRRKSV